MAGIVDQVIAKERAARSSTGKLPFVLVSPSVRCTTCDERHPVYTGSGGVRRERVLRVLVGAEPVVRSGRSVGVALGAKIADVRRTQAQVGEVSVAWCKMPHWLTFSRSPTGVKKLKCQTLTGNMSRRSGVRWVLAVLTTFTRLGIVMYVRDAKIHMKTARFAGA